MHRVKGMTKNELTKTLIYPPFYHLAYSSVHFSIIWNSKTPEISFSYMIHNYSDICTQNSTTFIIKCDVGEWAGKISHVKDQCKPSNSRIRNAAGFSHMKCVQCNQASGCRKLCYSNTMEWNGLFHIHYYIDFKGQDLSWSEYSYSFALAWTSCLWCQGYRSVSHSSLTQILVFRSRLCPLRQCT